MDGGGIRTKNRRFTVAHLMVMDSQFFRVAAVVVVLVLVVVVMVVMV